MPLGRKVFTTSAPELQFRGQSGFLRQLLPLRVQVGDALPEAEESWLTCVFVQETLRVTVNEPGHPLAQLAPLGLDERQGRTLRMGVRLEPTPVCLS